MKKMFMCCLLSYFFVIILTGCSNHLENKYNEKSTNEVKDIKEESGEREKIFDKIEVEMNNIDSGENKNDMLNPSNKTENSIETKNEPKDEDLVKIIDYIPNIFIDLKYATTDNFTGVVIYENDEAYLRYGTLKKIIKVQEELNNMGYSLLIWDAYRPVDAQFRLWEVCPNPTYVANPNNGYSSHSRGNTIDLSIVKLDGTDIEMPSDFDEFTKIADRDYSDVSEEAKENAILLENIMKKNGFNAYFGEWWHFSDKTSYEVVK